MYFGGSMALRLANRLKNLKNEKGIYFSDLTAQQLASQYQAAEPLEVR